MSLISISPLHTDQGASRHTQTSSHFPSLHSANTTPAPNTTLHSSLCLNQRVIPVNRNPLPLPPLPPPPPRRGEASLCSLIKRKQAPAAECLENKQPITSGVKKHWPIMIRLIARQQKRCRVKHYHRSGGQAAPYCINLTASYVEYLLALVRRPSCRNRKANSLTLSSSLFKKRKNKKKLQVPELFLLGLPTRAYIRSFRIVCIGY